MYVVKGTQCYEHEEKLLTLIWVDETKGIVRVDVAGCGGKSGERGSKTVT